MTRRRDRKERTHYAGRVGDAEYGVTTLSGPAGPRRDFCRQPCPQCPWRTDVPTGRFPAEAFRHSASTAYDMARNVFACHMAGTGRPLTCAGFLLQGAFHSLAVRMSIITGRFNPEEVSAGGAPLYDSYRAMAEANGVDPSDPALEACRSWDC